MVRRDLREGKLIAVLEDYPLPEASISAIFPEGRNSLPKVRAFVDFISEELPPRLLA
jgi:DNA-binding transcriptional LysR family regulator